MGGQTQAVNGCGRAVGLTIIGRRDRNIVCPAGQVTVNLGGAIMCQRPNDQTCGVGNPTQPGSGNKQQVETDFQLPGPNALGFSRTYNSFGSFGPVNAPTLTGGTLGINWRSTYDRQVFSLTGSATAAAVAWRQDGSVKYFAADGSELQHDRGARETLVAMSGGGWLYTTRDDTLESYDGNGRLLSITDRTGSVQTLTYDDVGKLIKVTDSAGRALLLKYDGIDRLSEVLDPSGAEYDFTFDTSGNLESITPPGAAYARIYQYNTNGLLTSISDENGAAYAAYSYEYGSSRVSSSVHAPNQANGTIDKYAFVYNVGSTTITTPMGQTVQYGLATTDDGVIRLGTLNQACAACGGNTQSFNYDAAGFTQSTTDFNGTTTQYTYDDARGLETQRIEAASTPASSSPAEKRTIQTDWHPTFRQPIERRTYDANNTLVAQTDWTYNSRGQVLTRTETDPVHPATPARTWTTTYCEQANINAGPCPRLGLTLQVDGPRTDVSDITTYAYRTADDPSCASNGACAYRKGDLWTVTDALGHVTRYVSYDGNGRVTRMQDANGTYTDLTYHARGWLLTRTVRANSDGSASAADATTAFAYDNVGNVLQMTQPDGAFLTYAYDDAHRLTDITDALGNSVHYSLDAAGHRTQETTTDPNGVLMRTLSRSYDMLGQLHQTTDALNHTSTWNYDGNGNATDSLDPLNTETTQNYDGLNRLTQTLQDITGSDPNTHNASTQYAYDALDNLVRVTDPNGLSTQYGYNALHDLLSLQSPDTGTATYTYDAAGNRLTQTDARGIVSSYSYDALNRLMGIGYPTASLNVSYAYDQPDSVTGCEGSFPIGRLTTMTDSSGSTTYCYDRRGNVLSATQTTGDLTLTTSYSYNLADRLTGLTYPSGTQVNYTRNALGQITAVSPTLSDATDPVDLVTDVSYLPFGPIATLSLGSGIRETRQYNQNYQIAAITHSGWNAPVPANAPANDYRYDHLYRLKEVDSEASGPPSPVEVYTYNPTGDRTGKTVNGTAQSYAYPSPLTSHRLQSAGGDARSYDANGNTTQIGATVLTYDDRNRLTQAGDTSYDYTGRGERVSKTTTAGTTHYVYSTQGNLLAEYQPQNQCVPGHRCSIATVWVQTREYVWLDGMLVGVVAGPVQQGDIQLSSQLYYVATDHLGTPRAVIDPASVTAIWVWDEYASAFGENAPNEDPDGDGNAFTFNLRYPGQYFDAETGLNYNYFRDYDPGTGRYIESDPIGLRGGTNTYGYATQRPLLRTDPRGLLSTVQWCLEHPEAAAECTEILPQPKPRLIPPPTFTQPDTGTKQDCKGNCSNTPYFSDFQECKNLPPWYKYFSKEQAAKSQNPGARAVRRQDADNDLGTCLQPGGHWRIEVEGSYIGFSVVECRCCSDEPTGPVIKSRYSVPNASY